MKKYKAPHLSREARRYEAQVNQPERVKYLVSPPAPGVKIERGNDMNIEQVKKQNANLGLYTLNVKEVNAIRREAALPDGGNEKLGLIALSYTYGFIRGRNAERNAKKRKLSSDCKKAGY